MVIISGMLVFFTNWRHNDINILQIHGQFKEMNDPNGCTNGDPNFTNRVLVIPANDTILPTMFAGEVVFPVLQ